MRHTYNIRDIAEAMDGDGGNQVPARVTLKPFSQTSEATQKKLAQAYLNVSIFLHMIPPSN